MDEIRLFIDWLISSFRLIFNFIGSQHVIVQAVVFMPLALLVIKLFLFIFTHIFQGGSKA